MMATTNISDNDNANNDDNDEDEDKDDDSTSTITITITSTSTSTLLRLLKNKPHASATRSGSAEQPAMFFDHVAYSARSEQRCRQYVCFQMERLPLFVETKPKESPPPHIAIACGRDSIGDWQTPNLARTEASLGEGDQLDNRTMRSPSLERCD